MDPNLLTLWCNIPSGKMRKDEIAKVLQLSPKQTARYLQRWTEEGWLLFSSGRGRGNVSALQWQKNVEQIFEEQALEMIAKEPVETTSQLLSLDWSPDCRRRLMEAYHTKFGYVQTTNDKLIIPKKYQFLTMHPLKAADVGSANIVANVFNRLVTVDEAGNVIPELAHSWDLTQGRLRLYLKKDVRFHDGSTLTAADVAVCLNQLRDNPKYRDAWSPIQEVRAVATLVVDILFPEGCSYCLQMLGMMNASIYKEEKDNLVGTGCFFVEENSEEKTVLAAFKDYFGERPLLDCVEFVKVPPDFEMVYRSAAPGEKQPTFQVESDSGFGVVVMNPLRNSAIRRLEVRQYLHAIIAKYRHELERLDERLLPNPDGCLIGHSHSSLLPDVKRPQFLEPILLQGVNYTKQTTLWLKDVFEREGIPVEVNWISFADNLYNSTNRQADLFIHGEIFEMNQNFSFYHFLSNGFSPIHSIVKRDAQLRHYVASYVHTPFDHWTTLNLQVEKELANQSFMIPLYYAKRQLPFSADLMNISLKHFGYVDLSTLWVRPRIPHEENSICE